MNTKDTISFLPTWRQAVVNFLQTSPKPGDTISKKWLFEQFGISEPTSIEEYEEAQLEFLENFMSFRDALLLDHCIDIKSSGRGMYSVVHPKDQTKIALADRTKKIAKEIRRLGQQVYHVDTAKLTDAERSNHTEGLAKVATLQAMFNRRALLGR